MAPPGKPSPEADAVLAYVCEAYWYPIYAFLRRRHSPHEAEDLTQGFFAHSLRRDWLREVGPAKGRFRTFVLKCLTNFVANEPRPPATVPIDFGGAEERFVGEPVDHATPEQEFDRRWAIAVLQRAAARLRREAEEAGRADGFAALFPYLTKETAPDTFANIAARLGITPAAARQQVSRMRRHYADAIRAEIAITASGPEEVEEELRHLMRVLSR